MEGLSCVRGHISAVKPQIYNDPEHIHGFTREIVVVVA